MVSTYDAYFNRLAQVLGSEDVGFSFGGSSLPPLAHPPVAAAEVASQLLFPLEGAGAPQVSSALALETDATFAHDPPSVVVFDVWTQEAVLLVGACLCPPRDAWPPRPPGNAFKLNTWLQVKCILFPGYLSLADLCMFEKNVSVRCEVVRIALAEGLPLLSVQQLLSFAFYSLLRPTGKRALKSKGFSIRAIGSDGEEGIIPSLIRSTANSRSPSASRIANKRSSSDHSGNNSFNVDNCEPNLDLSSFKSCCSVAREPAGGFVSSLSVIDCMECDPFEVIYMC